MIVITTSSVTAFPVPSEIDISSVYEAVVSLSKSPASLTVIAPVPELIANGRLPSPSPFVLPPVIDQPLASASSPVEAIVRTASSSAAFSAKLAELLVIEISTSVTEIATVSTSAPLASLARIVKVHEFTLFSKSKSSASLTVIAQVAEIANGRLPSLSTSV